jgi:hypothetical protein
VFESVIPRRLGPRPSRNVKEVPFVELAGGRVQGVVSSGSDIERVYVSFLEGRTGNFGCGTNNNRPCGGLRGSPCKHIAALVAEAVAEFGPARVASYLGLPIDPDGHKSGWGMVLAMPPGGTDLREPPGVVFSRFLAYLELLECRTGAGPSPEMDWFVP